MATLKIQLSPAATAPTPAVKAAPSAPFATKAPFQGGATRLAGSPQALGPGSNIFRSASGTTLRLGKLLARGGEGAIYLVEGASDLVAKIYDNAQLTREREAKIALMISRPLGNAAIAWPIDSLRDSHGFFRGFLMPKVAGVSLSQSLMNPQVFLADHPSWNRRNSCQLALAILQLFHSLHQNKILVGDINEHNILLRPDGSAAFVDCDSYQLEGFPCPVGTPDYSHPELHGKDFKTFLRQNHHERFALAILLFRLFLPGKHPYASTRNNGDVLDNIRQGHFPYCLGERQSQGVPPGPWRYCWSHLHRQVKEAFQRAFTVGAKSAPCAAEWIKIIRSYRDCIDRGPAFSGTSRQLGFCLDILPENRCYFDHAQIPPRLHGESRSEIQLELARLAPQNPTPRRSASSPKVRAAATPRRSQATPAPASSSSLLQRLVSLFFP